MSRRCDICGRVLPYQKTGRYRKRCLGKCAAEGIRRVRAVDDDISDAQIDAILAEQAHQRKQERLTAIEAWSQPLRIEYES